MLQCEEPFRAPSLRRVAPRVLSPSSHITPFCFLICERDNDTAPCCAVPPSCYTTLCPCCAVLRCAHALLRCARHPHQWHAVITMAIKGGPTSWQACCAARHTLWWCVVVHVVCGGARASGTGRPFKLSQPLLPCASEYSIQRGGRGARQLAGRWLDGAAHESGRRVTRRATEAGAPAQKTRQNGPRLTVSTNFNKVFTHYHQQMHAANRARWKCVLA